MSVNYSEYNEIEITVTKNINKYNLKLKSLGSLSASFKKMNPLLVVGDML